MVQDGRYFLYGFLSLALLGLAISLLVYRLHPLRSFPLALVLIAAFQYLAQKLCFDHGLVVPTLLPSFAGLSVFFAGVLYRYFTEEKEKRMVRSAFSRYVSGPVVEEILKDQSKLKLGGQKRVLTVMFCDLVGFTKLSESMDASRLTMLLNEYFTRMTRIILANQGTLDKYMGDAVMCFWGAPLELPGHASLACRSALEMCEELERINGEWREKYGLTIGLRIGLHTGEMNVGNMGSEQVFSYTVMGDNVNLGSRLEGVNNIYGTRITASAATRGQAGDGFAFRPLDTVRVKGKEEAVEIFELLPQAEAGKEWLHAFETALAAYRRGAWEEAEAAFGTCLTLKPGDKPAEAFLERIGELKANQPKEWDGVWKLNSK
jgi:adenylate cyclase